MDLEDILASDSEEGSVGGGGLGADVDAILAQADDGRVAGVEHDGGEISSDDEMLEAILQENSKPQALVAPVLQASNVFSHIVAVQSRPYGQSVAQLQPVASAALPRTTGSSAPHPSSSTMAALPAPVKGAAVPAPVAAAAPPAKQPSPLNHKHHTDEDILNALLASDSEDEDDGGLSAQIANAMSRVAPTTATTNSASRSQPASVMTPAARNAAVIAAAMRDRRDTRASSVTSASSGESGPSDGGGSSRRASFAAQAPAGALAQRQREETVEDILAAADAVAVQYLSPDKASQLLASGSAGGSSSAGLHINATSGRRAHHQQSGAAGGAGDDADSMLADIEAEVIVNRAARGHGANNAVFQSPEVALPSPMGINDDVDGIVRRAASAVRAARGAGVSVPLPRGLLSADDIINSADGAGDDEDDEGVGTSSSPAAHPRRNGAIQGDGSSGEGGGDLDLESIIQQYAASTTASASANSKGGSNNDGSNQHRDGKAAAGRRGSLEGLLADGDTSFDSSNQQLQRPGTRTEGRLQSGADAEADAGLALVHHSVNALKRAAARQANLLKSGNSKVVSPLAARRRFKPGLRSPQQALRAARSRVANRAAASGLTMHLPGVGTGMMGPSRRGSMESATASMISAALDDDGTGLSVSGSALGPQHQQDANGGSGIAGQELALTGVLRNGRSLISPYRSSATALLPPSLVEGADGEIDTSAILNATNQTVGRSIMGLLRVQPLQGLSDAIKRNMKNLATSPGLPTCITVHPKFTAIGTSRSLVMLFDNTQALRCILSRQPAGGVDNSKTSGGGDGAVTSMDSLTGLDFLLIGYASGRVTLVDTSNLAKSTVLKVAEVHKSSITAVRFTSFGAPNAVSVDAAGVVNFLSFSKVLGLRWSVESKCVLDGTRTGPIVSVAVLLPPLHAGTDGSSDGKGGSGNILTSAFSTGATSSGTGTAGGASAGGGAGASGAGAAGPLYGTLTALATRDYTYMLATNPEISVVHKWARPDGVNPAVVPSMAWARARVHGSAALDAAEERRSSATIMSALQPGQQHAHANSSLSLASVVDKAAAALGADTQHQRQGGPPSRRSSFSDQSSLARGGPGVAGDSDSTHGSGSATGASNAGADTPAAAAATAINMHRAAVAARYRHGSTLPYHGVMTAMPAPVLARAWGSHLQLLQVQPPGGYPMEQTNLAAPIEQFDGQHHMMVPHGPGAAGMPRQTGPPGRAPGQVSSGAGVGDAVFGSLTQALMSGGGLDNVGPSSGAPARHGQPGGAASATAAAAAAAASGRLMEFVLADDLDSQDPITSITWLGPSSLAYLTATDRLCLIDTSALEESDAVEMGSIKLVYASSSGASEGADAAEAGAATAGGAGKTSQQPPQTARSAASQPSAAAAASGSSAPSAQLASGAAIPIEPLDRYPPSVRGKLTSSLQNAMAVGQFEGSGLLHMLGLEQVFGARMQRWNERVSGLVAEGEWMSALALALDTYDTVTASHFTAIATAEKQARWNAMRAAALARIAVQSGAAVSVAGGAAGGPAAGAASGAGGAAKPGAASGAGSASPSVVSGASAADAAATAAANAQYDPVKFDRLRNGPGPAAKGTPIGDELDRLLKQYVSEMMANPPVDEGGKQASLPPKRQHAHHHRHTHSRAVGRSLAETHWVILSSVVIDYCVTIKRPDLLFGEIFDRFHAADKHAFLLEQLEPYILSDRLTVLPPLVLKSFVDHFRNIGALPSVERCLLHLDLASLDLDGSTRICLRHRLYSALVYVANAGLMDYSLPIDLMLAALMDDGNGLSSSSSQPGSKRNSFASAGRRGSDGSDVLDDTPNRGRSNTAASTDLVPMSSHDRTHLGYALMLYLAYCLTGRVFPSGKRADRHSTASSARGQQQHLDAPFSAALLPILPQEVLTPVAAVLFGQGRLPFIGAPGQRGGALIAGGAAGRQMMLGPGGARGPRAPGAGAGGAAGGAGGQYRQLSTWELLFTPVDKLRPALVTAGAPGADARVASSGGKGAIAPSGPAAAVSVAGPMQGVRSPAMARYGAAAAAGAAEGAGRPVVPALPAGRGMLPAGAAASGHQGPGDISGVVSPRTRAGGHTERRGHLPPGMTTQSLRSDTLAFLLTHKPDRFPAVGASVLSAGGLLAGAQACDHLPGPYPRLQVLLKFDAVAWYQLLGRLFTDAADSVLHTILLMEGLPGLRIRRRCLQGEQPPLVDVSGGRSAAAPATARAPAAQTEASSGQRRQQGGTGSQTNTPREGVGAATATGPSLQMILSATLDAAMSLVAATGGATTLSSSRLQQGGAASRLASSQSGSQQPLDNRVALALAFTVHQATRTGPGVPSLVTIPSSPPQLLTDVLLWLADVSSSKPSAAARPSRNALSGGHSLADSEAAVSDEVLNALLTAWDVRNDEDLYGSTTSSSTSGNAAGSSPTAMMMGAGAGSLKRAGSDLNSSTISGGGGLNASYSSDVGALYGGASARDQVGKAQSRSRSSSLVDAPHSLISPESAIGAAGGGATSMPDPRSQVLSRYTRQVLLVRTLRTVEVAADVRKLLLDVVRANDLHHAATILHALAGDAPAVVDAFIRAGTTGHDTVFASRVFNFVRGYVMMLDSAGGLGIINHASAGGSNNGAVSTAAGAGAPDDVPVDAGLIAATAPPQMTGAAARLGLAGLLPAGVEASEVGLAAALLSPDVSLDPEHERSLALMVKAEVLSRPSTQQALRSAQSELARGAPGGAAAASSAATRYGQQSPAGLADGDASSMSSTPRFEGSASAVASSPLPKEVAGLELRTLRMHLMRSLPKLVAINEQAVAELIVDLFPDKSNEVITALDAFPQLQYAYLTHFLRKAGVLGAAAGSSDDAADADASLQQQGIGGGQPTQQQSAVNVSPDIHLRYISLLCKFNPSGVVSYLSTASNYPLDATLQLVRDTHQHAEATAFLLERTGDPRSALDLLLTALENRLDILYSALKTAAASGSGDISSKQQPQQQQSGKKQQQQPAKTTSGLPQQHHPHYILPHMTHGYATRLHECCPKEVDAYQQSLNAAISLCTRAVSRYADEDLVEGLWFAALDTLVLRQRDVKNEAARTATALSSSSAANNASATATAAQAGHAAMLMTLGDGVKSILESMKTSVPLNRVLNKVLSDHSKAEFGEFRETIVSMMGTYSYEARILHTANHLMSTDIYRQVQRLHGGYAAAVAPSRSRGSCSACGTHLVAVGSGGKLVATAPGATTRAGRNRAETDGDDDEDGAKQQSSSGMLMVFGCGHCYHERCLEVAATTCPQCAQKENGGGDGDNNDADIRSRQSWRISATGRGGNGNNRENANSKIAHGVILGRAGVFGSTTGGGNRNRDNSIEDDTVTGNNKDATMKSLSATAKANSDNLDSEDVYRERLARTREKQRRGRPLMQLYSELTTAPGTMQVRTVELNTAPPRKLGATDGFKVVRRRAQQRDPAAAVANCTHASMDLPPFDE